MGGPAGSVHVGAIVVAVSLEEGRLADDVVVRVETGGGWPEGHEQRAEEKFALGGRSHRGRPETPHKRRHTRRILSANVFQHEC